MPSNRQKYSVLSKVPTMSQFGYSIVDLQVKLLHTLSFTTTPHHNRFTALFAWPPGWAGARRELPDFTVQGKINRGSHTDHPAGRHSSRTNQCLPPPSPHFSFSCTVFSDNSIQQNIILWLPYEIGQTIIFLPRGFFLSIFFFPRLISAAIYWMSIILRHMMWP